MELSLQPKPSQQPRQSGDGAMTSDKSSPTSETKVHTSSSEAPTSSNQPSRSTDTPTTESSTLESAPSTTSTSSAQPTNLASKALEQCLLTGQLPGGNHLMRVLLDSKIIQAPRFFRIQPSGVQEVQPVSKQQATDLAKLGLEVSRISDFGSRPDGSISKLIPKPRKTAVAPIASSSATRKANGRAKATPCCSGCGGNSDKSALPNPDLKSSAQLSKPQEDLTC